jgi:phage terminase large subunit GpA-like protein
MRNELPEMTDVETAAHIRKYANGEIKRSIWSWPTDACGYEQHIKFAEWRNNKWCDWPEDKTFNEFLFDYADRLENGEIK